MLTEKQKKIKEDLSLAYRACAQLKLDDLTYTHLSARACPKTFYLYRFGLLFQEVQPEHLIRLNYQGQIVEGQEMNFNPTGYALHSMIYEKKPQANAIFHLHTPSIVAISSLKKGLSPGSQWALHFYNKIGYHDYNSLALDKLAHQEKLLSDLKDFPVLLMRHHGAMIVASSIEEAFFYSYHLEKACQTQCLIESFSQKEVCQLDHEICQQAHHDLIHFEKNLGQRDFAALKRLLNSERVEGIDNQKLTHSLQRQEA